MKGNTLYLVIPRGYGGTHSASKMILFQDENELARWWKGAVVDEARLSRRRRPVVYVAKEFGKPLKLLGPKQLRNVLGQCSLAL